jgi:very-short-patch-repair endonuclease
VGHLLGDCLRREQRLAVELDSRAFHATPSAFEGDRERDRILQAAGWRSIRVTSRQLDRSRDELERDLRRMLGSLRLPWQHEPYRA